MTFENYPDNPAEALFGRPPRQRAATADTHTTGGSLDLPAPPDRSGGDFPALSALLGLAPSGYRLETRLDDEGREVVSPVPLIRTNPTTNQSKEDATMGNITDKTTSTGWEEV